MANPYLDRMKMLEYICIYLAQQTKDTLKLKAMETIYPSHSIEWLATMAEPLTVQVIDTGMLTVDDEGTCRREEIGVMLAIFSYSALDRVGRTARALIDESKSVFAAADAIYTALNLQFLTDDDGVQLHVRPISLKGDEEVKKHPNHTNRLLKVMRFQYGNNADY